MGTNNNDAACAILQYFRVERKNYAIEVINNGFINDTYLVLASNEPQYILQRINHGVFKDIDGLMSNLFLALQELDSEDYRRIQLIKTSTNSPYFKDENGYWRLMTYIAKSTTYNTTTNPQIAFEAGRIIGRFHQLMEKTNSDDYVDTIPDFHNLKLREKQFDRAKQNSESNKLESAKKAILFAEETLPKLNSLNQTKLPVRICHNDTKLNNILFSEETGKALCLIDLDTLMKGYFFYDFGDAIRTIVNTAPEDEKILERISFDRNLFDAVIDGIASNGPLLTQEEISTLSLGAVFMPFIHGLRALTDYLNNNIYYKVSYENQNLDRCLSLFDFTQKAYNQVEYMENKVTQKLR